MMIYFLCPESDSPAGGVRKIYRQVDVLNQNSIDAAVFHRQPDYRCSWFQNSTRIVYRAGLAPEDILVFPEATDLAILRACPPSTRKVVFNQNAYYTFALQQSFTATQTLYDFPGVIAAICLSEDTRQYLSTGFPNLPILRQRYSIDPNLFYPTEPKLNRIAFMPRKNEDHAKQVFSLLSLRGALHGFEITPLNGLNEQQTAQALRQSKLFFSFGFPEGFGLPPAEAMACGAVVVGYHGMGGREFFLPDHSFPIDFGDIVNYVTTAESVLNVCRTDPAQAAAIGARASQFIHSTYSVENETADILNTWRQILQLT